MILVKDWRALDFGFGNLGDESLVLEGNAGHEAVVALI